MIPATRLLLLITVLFVSVSFATAQDAEPAVDCSNAMTQADLNTCAYREYETEDATLNAEYRKAMAKAQALDGEYKDEPQSRGAVDALKGAQRAWIGYRDGQCVLAGFQTRGGSAESMLVSGCLADLTRKRTAELKAFLETEY